MKKTVLTTLLVAIVLSVAFADKPPVTKWTVKKPFEQRVFIENKGQYKLPGQSLAAADITYGACFDGLNYYFTKKGLYITHLTGVKNTGAVPSPAAGADANGGYTVKEQAYQLNFIGASPAVKIVAAGKVSSHYTFGTNSTNAVTAQGYTKITYTNIYSGIDVEFYFPADKQGFEYDIIAHPGADLSQVKIQYPLNSGLTVNEQGSVVVKSAFGDFTEHTPVATELQTQQPVVCKAVLNNGIVKFNTGNYDKSKDLKIDPWVQTPVFIVPNCIRVDWDNAGNCYTYGGGGYYYINNLTFAPFTVAKYNSSGTLLWTYTNQFTETQFIYIGDMAVDRLTQSVYITEGYNSSGAEITKLNSAGGVVATATPDASMQKLWLISFSRCVAHEAVVAGGNTNLNGPDYNNAFVLDKNDSSLANGSITAVNTDGFIYGYDDACLLALDNTTPNPNCFMALSTALHASNFNNDMYKFATPFTGAALWKVNEGYDFIDAASILFGFANNGAASTPNGYHGMAYGATDDLFTYDSYILKKWNASSGALVASKTINKGNVAVMRWAGLTSDQCENIFLGSGLKIKQYNGNLNAVDSISVGDTVYDVSLGNNGIVYACGQNFVTAIQTSALCNLVSFNNTTIQPTCTDSTGTVTVAISGGLPPYHVVWNTAPQQTGDTLAHVAPGTYIATITDSSCSTYTTYDTVTIINKSGGHIRVNSPDLCTGKSTTLTVSGANTYTWSPAIGLSATTGASVTANPTATTTYTVIGVGIGCSDTVQSVVTLFSSIKLSVTPTAKTICSGQTVTLIASGADTYQWTPSTGLNITTGDTVLASPIDTTTYTVIGTRGCVDSTKAIISVKTTPDVKLDIVKAAPCVYDTAILTLSAQAGTTYKWSPATGLNVSTGDSVVAKPAVSTTYTIVGTLNGCADTITAPINYHTLPVAQFTPAAPAICSGQNILLTVSGGLSYRWLGTSDFNDTITVHPVKTTIYAVQLNDTFCFSYDTVVVTVNPPIAIVPQSPGICAGDSVTLMVPGGSNLIWSPATGLSSTTADTVVASPIATTTYTVTGTDSLGCANSTATDTVTVHYGPNKPIVTVSVSGDTLISSAPTGNQWYINGVLVGTDSILRLICKAGYDSLTLVVTNSFGCSTSTTYYYICTGINTLTLTDYIQIYPNPFNDELHIVINTSFGSLQGYNLQLTDILGRVIYNTPVVNYYNEIDMTKLPAGVYFVSVINGNDKIVKMVVKEN